jgi:hypothetical protein
MKVTTLNPPQPNPLRPKPPQNQVADIDGDKVTLYEFDSQGKVKNEPGKQGNAVAGGLLTSAKGLFLPSNMPNSVSKDYLPTRRWAFMECLAGSVAGFCAGAAIGGALGIHPVWGGAAMATFNLIRDRASQVTGFLASFLTPKADRNPRVWMVYGQALEHAGTVMDAASAVVPGALLPIAVASGIMRTAAGTMKGAAMANIGPRQAVADNLGEVGAKNGNQGFVASLGGALIGLAATSALTGTLGATGAPVLVAAAGSVLACLSQGMMVKSLDYHPLNELAVERIVENLEKEAGQVVGPERRAWTLLPTIGHADKLTLGQPVRPLLDKPERFEELKTLYRDRKHILEVDKGQLYIVLLDKCAPEDRFASVLQATYVTRMIRDPKYQEVQAEKGQEAADRWLVESSLQKTPVDCKPMLEQLKQAGWSSDALRFYDNGIRASIQSAA